MNPFFVLGISPDAKDEEIEKKYLACIQEFPPDRAPEHFMLFRQAYEKLQKEEERVALQLKYFDHTGRALTEELALLTPQLQRKRLSFQQIRALIFVHNREGGSE